MKTRIGIIAACAGTLVLTFGATPGNCEQRIGFEKTFLGGDASVGRAKRGKNAGGKISDNESPRPQDRATVKSSKSNTSDRMGGGGGKGSAGKREGYVWGTHQNKK